MGEPRSLLDLGALYEKGSGRLGIEQNVERAVSLYGQAAAKGHPEAQLKLGYIYRDGLGSTKPNLEKV